MSTPLNPPYDTLPVAMLDHRISETFSFIAYAPALFFLSLVIWYVCNRRPN